MKTKNLLLAVGVGVFCLWAAPAFAQVSYNWQSSYAYGWLRSPQIQKELEVADYQLEKIKEIQSEVQTKTQEIYAKIRELPREDQTAAYRDAQKEVQELYKEQNKKLEDVLLPQQVRRLEQITTQMQMRGGAAYGLRGALAEKIGLTEEQQAELKEKAAEKNKELYAKYAEMKAEMEKELLDDVLTAKQRKELKELIGEPFEYNYQQGTVGRGGAAQGGGNQGGSK